MHALVHRHISKSNLVDKKPDTYLDNFYVMNSFLFMLKTITMDILIILVLALLRLLKLCIAK